MERATLVDYLDEYLRVEEVEDKSQNGLQVEGPGEVTRVAMAVDGCQASVDRAVEGGAQLLIVHHGFFWEDSPLLVGPHFERVKTLVEGDCGLYAVHLPLDMHPEVGHNAEMVRLLRLKDREPFGDYHGIGIGFAGRFDEPVDVPGLIGRVVDATGRPPIRVLDYGPKAIKRVGCVSGGAASLLDQVPDAGLDAYITGETSHTSFHQAVERKLNVLFAGHYATETLGLRALARHLEGAFELETFFLDIPTGM
jgi:dinuclear metal center YbgI/SA1388 family protein